MGGIDPFAAAGKRRSKEYDVEEQVYIEKGEKEGERFDKLVLAKDQEGNFSVLRFSGKINKRTTVDGDKVNVESVEKKSILCSPKDVPGITKGLKKLEQKLEKYEINKQENNTDQNSAFR